MATIPHFPKTGSMYAALSFSASMYYIFLSLVVYAIQLLEKDDV